MATLQLMPVTTINGTTYATAKLILTPANTEPRKISTTKMILPKQETTTTACDGGYKSPPDFLRICQNMKSDNAKRRIHFSKKALTHPRPQSVTRRNTRERNRVKAVNQGFVTLASHVPPHLRGKKMSKVDTLRAAITYIQDLQEALENNGELPIRSPAHSDDALTQSDVPSSPTTSTCSSSDVLPSSPSYQPVSPAYRAPAVTCHAAQPAQTTQYAYLPQLEPYPQPTTAQTPAIPGYYQPQYQQGCYSYGQVPNRCSGFNIDFTRPHSTDTCPSPASSCYTSSDHEQITPEVEAELLEFASWFH